MSDTIDDQRHWDIKHARRHKNADHRPDADLVRHIGYAPETGMALDIACGTGRNSVLLAEHGLDVICMDLSAKSLEMLMTRQHGDAIAKKLFPVQADLTQVTLPDACFDLVIVIRYLDRRAFSGYLETLKPGGLLFLKTFNRNHLIRNPGFNPDYLLAPGELMKHFKESENLHSNDDQQMKDSESFILIKK